MSVTLDEVSASVAFPSGLWGVMAIFNDSTFNAFVKTGSGSVSAALTDTPIPPAGYMLLGKETGHTHVAAIGPTGANGTVYFVEGEGA